MDNLISQKKYDEAKRVMELRCEQKEEHTIEKKGDIDLISIKVLLLIREIEETLEENLEFQIEEDKMKTESSFYRGVTRGLLSRYSFVDTQDDSEIIKVGD